MTPPTVEYREISLTRGLIAYVSPHRYDEINAFKWLAMWDKRGNRFYAYRNIKVGDRRTMISMHRQILGLGYGDPRQADHVNRNETLNNTDDNLRVSSRFEQNRNRGKQKNNKSGYKGVCWSEREQRWMAQIRVDGKVKFLGYFRDPKLAYATYCEAALKYYGEFACLE